MEYVNYSKNELTRYQAIRLMPIAMEPTKRKHGEGNVYISNLHKSITEQQLYATFSQFGRVLSCYIASDLVGRSLQYGYIHFEQPKTAEKAITAVNGKLICGRKVSLERYRSKADRKRMAEEGIVQHSGNDTCLDRCEYVLDQTSDFQDRATTTNVADKKARALLRDDEQKNKKNEAEKSRCAYKYNSIGDTEAVEKRIPFRNVGVKLGGERSDPKSARTPRGLAQWAKKKVV